MTYTTGVAVSATDFIEQLMDFAIDNAGFVDAGSVYSSVATGERLIRRLSKGGVYFQFLRQPDNRGILAAMGYLPIPSNSPLPQPYSALPMQEYFTNMTFWQMVGPFVGHYFFTEGTCVHAVLELSSGVFNHISFGRITPHGPMEGGEYITSHYNGRRSVEGAYDPITSGFCTRPFDDDQNSSTSGHGYMRVGNTNTAADFRPLRNTGSPFYLANHTMFVGTSDQGNDTHGSFYGRLLRDSPSTVNNRTPILPGLVRAYDPVSQLKRLAGYVPNVGVMKMSPDQNPKDIVDSDWQIFPITQRTGGNSLIATVSGELALAYRRVA